MAHVTAPSMQQLPTLLGRLSRHPTGKVKLADAKDDQFAVTFANVAADVPSRGPSPDCWPSTPDSPESCQDEAEEVAEDDLVSPKSCWAEALPEPVEARPAASMAQGPPGLNIPPGSWQSAPQGAQQSLQMVCMPTYCLVMMPVLPGQPAGLEQAHAQPLAGQADDLPAQRLQDASASSEKVELQKEAILPLASKHPEPAPGVTRTTVLLRNMPNNQTRKMLVQLLNRRGFEGQFDFLYLPIDFNSRISFGYAFVNFVSEEAATRAMKSLEGFTEWEIPSRKVCGVSWSWPHQGLESHIERYRNSPVMHRAVPDMFKPLLLKNGVRSSFPAPTQRLRAPRIRSGKGQ